MTQNCDPDAVDFPIPGNDDALKSVQLIARAVSDAIISEKEKISPEEILAATEAAQEEGASDKEVELKRKRRRYLLKRQSVSIG